MPEALVAVVMKHHNEDPMGGHLGEQKTIDRVRATYYW